MGSEMFGLVRIKCMGRDWGETDAHRHLRLSTAAHAPTIEAGFKRSPHFRDTKDEATRRKQAENIIGHAPGCREELRCLAAKTATGTL